MPKRPAARRVVKPHIAIVGAGSLGTSLALALHNADYVIDEIVSRGRAASVTKARRLAAQVGASAVSLMRVQIRAGLVWFCVPDGGIASAAAALSDANDWHGKVALHASGALTSDELAELRRRGAWVASVHPLMTFVPGSRPPLTGVPFAIEGDRKAALAARAIVLNLGGRPFPIGKRYKQAYHTWGMFVSPLLTALLAASERVAATAGVKRSVAKQRMLPILRQTLANYAALGASHSFSGPIARGDVETVRRHLNALSGTPEARNIYIALAQTALRDLPAKNRVALEKILKK
jgi:predicted short-subunit dehydrogenase-like oxidoreductase (DUF2520 family)